jgi:hypothetical protein
MAYDLQVGITALRGRRPEITYLYEDPEDPTKVTGALGAQQFTGVDRALFLALRKHEDTLCPGCGEPKDRAWHSGTKNAWDETDAVCHVCTLQRGEEVAYTRVRSTLTDEQEQALPEFVWGVTTTPPRSRPDR